MWSCSRCRYIGIDDAGAIKAPIDKLYSSGWPKGYCRQAMRLIACCEEDDMSVLDGVLMPYQKHRFAKWTSIGEV